jgi:type I restriction enzyme S subunit
MTLVSKTLDNRIFSHDLIRLDAKSSVDIGYIYAYLRSSTGNALLQTNNYGAVIQHIEPEHLADVTVPNPPDEVKKKINGLILRSFELRDESNELIDMTKAMLIEELKLPPLNGFKLERLANDSKPSAFEVKMSELEGRLDASYHLPIVKAITKHLRTHAAEVTTVGDKRVSKDIILPGRFKRVYVEKGRGRVFLGGKQIYELDPYGKKYLSFSKHSARIKAELEIAENTILVTRSGTVGKVNIVPKHWEHWIASDHIIRIIPTANPIAGYLFAFLTSECGHALIERFTYGSVVDEIDDHHVSQIPFPFLKNAAAQAEINRLALQANELRYQAYKLEQDALSVLEDEVLRVE